MKEIQVLNVKIQYDEGNIRILDSYKIQDESEMEIILQIFLIRTEYRHKRTINSWIKELKAHNWLYKRGLCIEHTKDCDLEEKEKLHRLIIYEILARF